MTRDELRRLLTAALRVRAVTDAQAATILRSFDAGTLDTKRAEKLVAAGEDRKAQRAAAALAALLLLEHTRQVPGAWTYSPATHAYTAPAPVGPIAPVGLTIPSTGKTTAAGAGRTIPAGPVSAPDLRLVVDHTIDAAESEMLAQADALAGSRISLAAWFGRMEDMIAERHIAMAAAARGGFDRLTYADRLWIREKIETQFGFLDKFADDILSGAQPLDGRYRARVQLYSQAARGTFEDMRRRVWAEAGMTEERRRLGDADHCDSIKGMKGCPELASLGWQPIGSLPRIGDTPCRTRCRCRFEFRGRRRA